MFLLRLSPIVPFVLLNYGLAFSGVRYRDFLLASVGMLPAILMYVYYGKVVGDVAKVAAGVAPPRGPEYYVLLGLGLVATIVATTVDHACRAAINRESGVAVRPDTQQRHAALVAFHQQLGLRRSPRLRLVDSRFGRVVRHARSTGSTICQPASTMSMR